MKDMVEKYKILAVDDNPINLKLLSSALINSDYEIYTASSGKEALELTHSVLPDLILLDVMMPDMDGYEVCKKLQEDEQTRFIPVIFLSARNEVGDKAKGLALGAVDYLTKPFNPLEISARVRTHLSSRKAIISLKRKNQQLQEEIEKLKSRVSPLEENLTTYLQKIDGQFWHLKESTYEFFSLVRSAIQPITRNAVPVFSSKDRLAVLHFNGFNKDYPTLIVKQLISKFLEGFFLSSSSEQSFDEPTLSRLFLKLLEKFSPDIYQVHFTFAISVLNLAKSQLFFYGLHQRAPLVILANGSSKPLTGQLIEIESELKNFITAIQAPMESGQWIAWYQNSSKPAEINQVQEIFLPVLEKSGFDFQQFVLLLDQQIKPGKKDVSFALLKIKE